MKGTRWSPTPLVILGLLAAAQVGGQAPCSCFDMRDLMNREAEAEAAIAAYQGALAAWSAAGATPTASEVERARLQAQVQVAMNGVSDVRANKVTAETDPNCQTHSNTPGTACLREVLEQHEFVHRNACQQHYSDSLVALLNRWRDMAEYADEEIQAYRSELAYVRASLSNLERECRFTLEFRSTISGKAELVTSNAKADVPLSMSLPKGSAAKGLSGGSTLTYDTFDPGPPTTVIGPSPVSKQVPACYVTFQGKGGIGFGVVDGVLMRQKAPPYDPLIELTVFVGNTSETFKWKGGKKCPRLSIPSSYWSARFLLSKQPTSGPTPVLNQILVDGWTIAPRAGVFAEKVISGGCLPPGGAASMPPVSAPGTFGIGPTAPGVGTSLTVYPAGVVPGLLASGICAETTTLTLKVR